MSLEEVFKKDPPFSQGNTDKSKPVAFNCILTAKMVTFKWQFRYFVHLVTRFNFVTWLLLCYERLRLNITTLTVINFSLLQIILLKPLDCWVDKASATDTIDQGSNPGWLKPDYKNWYSQLFCLGLLIKWTVWSFHRARSKRLFAVSMPC